MIYKPSDKFAISPEVLCQEVGGEMVLLDLHSDYYFGLDETGTRVWQLLQSGSSLQEVIGKLLDEFEVERETLEADVNDLLGRLVEAELVSVDTSAS